jgi:hypothetical protein
VFFPAADTVAIGTNGTEALRVNSSQNVGVGITPSAWGSGRPAIEMAGSTQGNLAFNGTGRSGLVITNAYHDGTNWRYKNTGFSSAYALENGANAWYSAPSGTAGNVAVYTQLLAVEAGKSVALQGATSQTGTGITFPDTWPTHASSNPNTLDDYEEGTFTPTFVGTGGVTYGSGTYGVYTKIGNLVSFNLMVITTALTRNANGLIIGGLPFTSSNISEYFPPTSFFGQNGFNKTGILFYQPLVERNSTQVRVWAFVAGTGDNYVSVTYNDMVSTTNWVRITGQYIVG